MLQKCELELTSSTKQTLIAEKELMFILRYFTEMLMFIKAMDQPGLVTRFLLYRHFSLCNLIFIKIKTGN